MLQNSAVTTRLMALDDARASGARALFGEKYGDEVRVVAMGEGVGNTMGWSVELCGGTHVRRTGDIGLISGVSDSGVAAGVRRIEALTGTAARKAAQRRDQLAKAASSELKVSLEDMPARIAALLDERKKLERELSEARKKLAMGGGGKAARRRRRAQRRRRQAAGARGRQASTSRICSSLADEGKKQVGSGVVAIVGVTEDGKAGVVVGVTADLDRALQRRRSGAARAPRRSAARAAAAGPTWRRPAGRTAPRPTRRSRRSRPRSAADADFWAV